MSQPVPISVNQLNAYRDQIRRGGLSEVRSVYSDLNAHGYHYAGWALGVATGSTLTGQSALTFLENTALFGVGAEICRDLTPAQLDGLRIGLIEGYLSNLIRIANQNNGILARDILYQENLSIHEVEFSKQGLSISNWTLYRAMDLIRRTEGEAAVEQTWISMRDTAGDGFDAFTASTGLFARMSMLALSTDRAISTDARAWIRNVVGPDIVDSGDPLLFVNRALGWVKVAFASQTATDAAPPANTPPPEGDGSAARDSFALARAGNNHTATLHDGGSLWDLWIVQRGSQNGFAIWEDFRKAVLANNPNIIDPQSIPAGQVIWVPQRLADGTILSHFANGSTTHSYANGVIVHSNMATGEYHATTPTEQGGFRIYQREADADAGYLVSEFTLDAQGKLIERFTGYQASLESPITSLSRQRIQTDAAFDAWGGFDPFSNDNVFTNDDAGQIVVNAPPAPVVDIGTLFNVEERLHREYTAGWLSASQYYAFQDFTINYSLTQGSGSGLGLQPPSGGFWSDPIGAFYDSQSAAFDHAASVAAHTGVLLDANQRRLSPRQFSFLDIDSDGSLHASETVGLSLWRDLNENGRADTGEIIALADSGLGPIDRKDWALRAQGQAGEDTSPLATAHLSPGAPAEPLRIQRMTPLVLTSTPTRPLALSLTPPSNYRQLRDSYNVYAIPDGRLINWTASQVKINFNSTDALIGTDGNDAFDARYYSAYASWFQLDLLTRFLGGGGNDIVGGSSRADSLWGGTGNDTLWGYEGNDKL